jgi:hypothetical protein
VHGSLPPRPRRRPERDCPRRRRERRTPRARAVQRDPHRGRFPARPGATRRTTRRPRPARPADRPRRCRRGRAVRETRRRPPPDPPRVRRALRPALRRVRLRALSRPTSPLAHAAEFRTQEKPPSERRICPVIQAPTRSCCSEKRDGGLHRIRHVLKVAKIGVASLRGGSAAWSSRSSTSLCGLSSVRCSQPPRLACEGHRARVAAP